jgi:ABC-type spermidine/putrescine transport system permease subunit II
MSSVSEKLQTKPQRSGAAKQVRLKLVYVDFWSALKLSFLVALCVAIVMVVATALIYLALESTGIFGQIDDVLTEVLGPDGFSVQSSLSFNQVLTFAAIIGALNTVIGTVLGAIACLLYNLSVRLTGGLLVGFTNN